MAKKKISKRAKQTLATVADYKTVFNSEAGRRVLWNIMKNTSMLSPSFVPGDPHATSYNEGTRSTCLHILKKLNTNVEDLQKRITEGELNEASIFETYKE